MKHHETTAMYIARNNLENLSKRTDEMRDAKMECGDDGTIVRKHYYFIRPQADDAKSCDEMIEMLENCNLEASPWRQGDIDDGLFIVHWSEIASSQFGKFRDDMIRFLHMFGWKEFGWECNVVTGKEAWRVCESQIS